ncbi:MAG: DUF2877 domain-containing protein [Elusimicrobia bacterium]|nr:DUF2877 domain-containing protein [Elusimicrobiota bacterium]
MEIIGFGDSIPLGTFDLHSAFENALNFQSRGFMISLVNRKTGNGPFNVVLKQLPPGAKRLKTARFYLYIDENRLACDPSKAYDSSLPELEIAPDTLWENLAFLKNFLVRNAPRKSLRFLFEPRSEKAFTRLFERKMLERVKKAVSLLEAGSYAKGARSLKGLGFGLTPSGDDFLSGYLTGLGFAELNLDCDVAEVIEEVYKNAVTENLISNSFLMCAYDGLVGEKVKKLLIALVRREQDKLARSAGAALRNGHTSGADFCVGLIYGCEAGLRAS